MVEEIPKKRDIDSEKEVEDNFVIEIPGAGDFRERRHVNGRTHKAERREFFKGKTKVGDIFLDPETEEPQHGFMYDDAGNLKQFEDWEAMKKEGAAILKLLGREEEGVKDIEHVFPQMRKLPVENYGDFWLQKWSTQNDGEMAEYINKKTGVIERRTVAKNGQIFLETIYNKETGKPETAKEFGVDGEVRVFEDLKAINNYFSEIDDIFEDDSNKPGFKDAEIERLKMVLKFENFVSKDEKLQGPFATRH